MALFTKNRKRKDVTRRNICRGMLTSRRCSASFSTGTSIRCRGRAIPPPRSRGPVCSSYTRISGRGSVFHCSLRLLALGMNAASGKEEVWKNKPLGRC